MSPMSPRLLRPRQNIHPEAADWANRVRTNGGTVSGLTLAAVGRFCRAIDAAGIRGRFTRLNLICGGFEGAFIPLYRAASPTGVVVGGTSDTNAGNAFLTQDFNETGASGGLLGDGSSKYIDTGLTPDAVSGLSSGHISVYHTQASGLNQTRTWVGARDTAAASQLYLQNGFFSASAVFGQYGGTTTANFNTGGSQTGAAGGHRVVSRESANRIDNYYNAVSQANSTVDQSGAIAGVVATRPLYVFAFNNQGTASGFMNGRLRAYSIGLGMTSAQITAFYNAMLTFQTALLRNV